MLYSQGKSLLPFALVILGIVLTDVASTNAQGSPTPEQIEDHRKILDQWNRANKGTIRLGGEIFDDEGRPLSGVTLRIRTSRPSLFDPFDDGYSRKMKVVAGAFRYKCNQCSTVHLHFSKEGYHREEMEFVYNRKQHGKRLESTALRIKLDRLRSPVTLVEISGVLSIGSGSVKVVPIALQPTSASAPLEWLVAQLKKEGGDLAQLLYLKLDALLHADGTPVTVSLDRPGLPKGQRLQPVSAVLDFSMANGGAVLYEPSESETWRIYDSMRRAPESGYVPRLALDRWSTGESYKYFYCKLGDYYGKGSVGVPKIKQSSSGLVATSYIEIWINRDGGRSVEKRR